MCDAEYDDDQVHLRCVMYPDHEGPHWHRPACDIRENAGIHWFDIADYVPPEPVQAVGSNDR